MMGDILTLLGIIVITLAVLTYGHRERKTKTGW